MTTRAQPAAAEPAAPDDTFRASTKPGALLTRLRAYEKEREAHMRRERFKALNWIVASLALIVAGAVSLADGPSDPWIDAWTTLGTLLAWGAIIGAGIWGLVNVPRVLGMDPKLDRTRDVLKLLTAIADDWHPRTKVTLMFDLRDLEDTPPRRTGTSPYSGATKKWYRLPRFELVGMLADGTMIDVLLLESAKTKAGSHIRRHDKLRLRMRPRREDWTLEESELKVSSVEKYQLATLAGTRREVLLWGDMEGPGQLLPVLEALHKQLAG